MEFEWHKNKNNSNFEKHGIRFEYAKEIFLGPTLTKVDERKNYGEVRENSIGRFANTILFVTHTNRNGRIRIISARKANRHERESYYDYIERRTD